MIRKNLIKNRTPVELKLISLLTLRLEPRVTFPRAPCPAP